MRILLSNDDGYQAPGLRLLADALTEIADVVVVAPDRGTPTDCVHVAITGLLDREPDMVISGVNHGANLGDDVLYSGTVAAAMEGRFLGLPAVAVSLVLERGHHFATAVTLIARIVRRMITDPLPSETILNINVPDLRADALQGLRVTRLGFRHRSEPVVPARDPKNRPVYWVGPAGEGQDAGPGTDFHAVANGFASVTPIKVDFTDHRALESVDAWMNVLE